MPLRDIYGGFKGPEQRYASLLGETIHEARGGLPCVAGVRINSDGTVDKRNANGTYTQIDAATDWVIPNGDASIQYEVFATVDSGTLTGAGASEDTWLDLGTDRLWWLNRTTVGTDAAVLTISIRYQTGSTLTSGVYDLEAERTS